MMKSCRSMVFSTTQTLLRIESVINNEIDLTGYGVGLPKALIWAREARLHNSAQSSIEFNIKIDGRPLYGFRNSNSPILGLCIDTINSLDLTKTCLNANTFSQCTPIKHNTNTQVTPKTSRIKLLEKELSHKCKARDVEAALLEATIETPQSTPLDIDEADPSSNGLTSILSSNVGPISKKRAINALCKRVWQNLIDSCRLYDVNMGHLLGNACIYGDESLKNDVEFVIQSALETIVEKKDTKPP
ncbi:hypothetical protein AC249_AIPGENE10822 [Exaiptasia diaphana]|nr:hypothetical protein AC249_AIPGENE10822 [Exaiptasia diaphana]